MRMMIFRYSVIYMFHISIYANATSRSDQPLTSIYTCTCIIDTQERREARLSRRRERERRNRALESAEEREARLARRRVLKEQSSTSCTVYCSLASQTSLVPRLSRPGYEARARRISVNACARMRSRKYCVHGNTSGSRD